MTEKNIKVVMEWLKDYEQIDHKEVYSNGIEYVPLFRVEQALEFLDEEKGEVKEFCTCG